MEQFDLASVSDSQSIISRAQKTFTPIVGKPIIEGSKVSALVKCTTSRIKSTSQSMNGNSQRMTQSPVSTDMITIKRGTNEQSCRTRIGFATERFSKPTRLSSIGSARWLALSFLGNWATREISF